MRQRTIGDWFFRLTFVLPVFAAIALLGTLGLLGVADWCGGGALCASLWKVFLGAAAGFLGLALLIRVVVLALAAVGMFALVVQRLSQGAALLMRTALRGT